MGTPRIITECAEMQTTARALHRDGKTIGLVPTMGYLHAGHLSLIHESVQRADVTVVSIFVNPTQFGANEDLDTYPRDWDGDLAKSADAGADIVFAPTPEGLYPEGYQTYVTLEDIPTGACGASRPVHFRGVATVCTKLFNLVQPDIAVFGQKDFQQLLLIKQLVKDLHLPIDIIGMPTVREPDGLAMSSRNAYLSEDDRPRALALSRGLDAAQTLFDKGVRDEDRLVAAVVHELVAEETGVDAVDYVELRDADTFAPVVGAVETTPVVLVVAAQVGATRLIDNRVLGA